MKAYNCVKLNQVAPRGMAILPLEEIGEVYSCWRAEPYPWDDGVHIYAKTGDWDNWNYGFISNESL